MSWDYISVTWTPGVEENDAQTLTQTISHIYGLLQGHLGVPGQFDPLPVVRVFGAWTFTDLPEHTPYSSINDYILHALDDESHLVASRYLEYVRQEPWQANHPHFDFVLTDLPVLNNINGETVDITDGFYHSNTVAMVSLYPIGTLNKPHARQPMVRRTVAHYFGRLFGVLDRDDDIATHNGLTTCANVCAMRVTRTPEHTLDFTMQENAEGITYCPTCQYEFVARLTSAHYGWN